MKGDPLETSGPPFIATDMEAHPVLNHHVVVKTCTHILGERCHGGLVGGLTHFRHQPEAAFTAFRADKGASSTLAIEYGQAT